MLKPDQNQILRYGGNDSIIIERLISESPKGKTEPYNLAIEKLIVDLFASEQLTAYATLRGGSFEEPCGSV